MMGKSASRIMAVQVVHALCSLRTPHGGPDPEQFIEDFLSMEEFNTIGAEGNRKFLNKLVCHCMHNLELINSQIQLFISNDWQMSRIDNMYLALARVGASEIISCTRNPLKVIISEYILIAEMFVEKEGTKFVHALLDKIGNAWRPPNNPTHDIINEK